MRDLSASKRTSCQFQCHGGPCGNGDGRRGLASSSRGRDRVRFVALRLRRDFAQQLFLHLIRVRLLGALLSGKRLKMLDPQLFMHRRSSFFC
jgi:hypothetical protein